MEEVVEVESDQKTNSALLIDEPAAGVLKDSAVMGCAVQSPSTDSRAVPFVMGVEAPMDV